MASTFRFRFKSLLQLRRAARDERSADLALALEAHSKLQGWIADVNQELRLLRNCRNSVGTLDTDRILSAASYEGVLRNTLRQYELDLVQVAQEVERRREALMLADQAVRVMEKLREKQQQQFQHEFLLREGKFLDEVTTSQTYRQQLPTSSESE